MEKMRLGLARMQVALIIVVLVVAAGLGAYAISTESNSNEVRIQITETDSVNQVDNFVPQNVTVKVGTPVTFAVFDGDDENRVFTIATLNLNLTISPGTTARSDPITLTKTGTFTMYSPKTLPSAASNGKPGTPCTGYLIVTD